MSSELLLVFFSVRLYVLILLGRAFFASPLINFGFYVINRGCCYLECYIAKEAEFKLVWWDYFNTLSAASILAKKKKLVGDLLSTDSFKI